jgi:uncharacterized repeat protein (TIGR03833 family)
MHSKHNNKNANNANKATDINNDMFDWYKIDSTIMGVAEKDTGGYMIKVSRIGKIDSFVKLIKEIIDYYKFQYLTLDSTDIPNEYTKELKKLYFETFQKNNYVFQEQPKIGDQVIIAIKPYEGKYMQGKIKMLLTNVKYHPRGVKVVLDDTKSTVGRIAIIKKAHI